jgi:putative membrane protein
MRMPENLIPRQFLIAVAVVATLGGCSTSRKQPASNTDASSAAAQPSAQTTALQPQAKATPFVPPPEVSSKKTNAAILERIHLADLKEIEAGKIAEAKASSPEVREYADQLIKDHTSADQMVTATAQKIGARLRDSSTQRHKGTPVDKKLSSVNGARFDRVFLEQTSAEHKKLMTELKQARDDASDDDIEALIDKIMPILQQHQDLAQILMKKEPA